MRGFSLVIGQVFARRRDLQPRFDPRQVSRRTRRGRRTLRYSRSVLAARLVPAGFLVMCLMQSNGPVWAQQTITLPEIDIERNGPSALNADGSTAASGGFVVPKVSFGPYGTIDQNNLPFSTNSFPRAIIEDQQAKTTADVLRNDPSVYNFAPASVGGYPIFRIRGFQASDPQANRLDGLPFTPQASELLYGFSRIDILKGASGLLYGFSNPGGVIDYVSKRPLDGPLTELTPDYASPTWFGGAADVSRRFGYGDQLGARVNLAAHGGDLDIDHQRNANQYASLSLDWRVAPTMTAWFFGSYGNDAYRGLQPTFQPTGALPKAPDAARLYGQDFSGHTGTTEVAIGGIEGDPLPWLSGHVTGGVINGLRDVRYNGGSDLQSDGDYSYYIGPHNLWRITDYSLEAVLSPHFDWGVIRNKTDFGATLNYETTHFQGVQDEFDFPQAFNIFHPTFVPEPYVPYSINEVYTAQQTLNNFSVRDTLDVTKFLTVIGGVSYATYDLSDHDVGDGYNVSTHANQTQPSPSGAVIIKPVDGLSVYGSYIQGLQVGSQASDTYFGAPVTNAMATLPPFISQQFEAGIKYNVNEAVQVNAAWFQIDRPNAIYVPATGGAYTFAADGKQTNSGVEFTVAGKISDDLRVFGGLAYTEPKITGSQGGTLDGKDALGVPRIQGSMFIEYDLASVRGLTLLAGVFGTGRAYVDDLNTIVAPSHVTCDLGAKYQAVIEGNDTTFRVYVQNALGSNYWIAANGGGVVLGNPRTFQMQASVRF